MTERLPYTLIDGIRCYSPEVAAAYTDYPDSGFALTDEEGDRSFWVRSRNRLFRHLLQKQFVPYGKTRFLEIGCGTGRFIQHIADMDRLAITGSEVYLKGLSYAKKNLPEVEFVQFDVERGVIGEEFDVIAAFDVIEHIDNDTAALANMGTMLPPGGSLILSVPQYMFLWGRLDEIVKHKRRYSRSELVTKLEQSGFEVAYCTSFVCFLFPLMWMSRMADRSGDHAQPEKKALEKRVKFSGVANWILDQFMRVDEMLVRMGLSLPFGGTLVVVARKLP